MEAIEETNTKIMLVLVMCLALQSFFLALQDSNITSFEKKLNSQNAQVATLAAEFQRQLDRKTITTTEVIKEGSNWLSQLLVSLLKLEARIESGEPFADELEAVIKLGQLPQPLMDELASLAIKPAVKTGIKSFKELQKDFFSLKLTTEKLGNNRLLRISKYEPSSPIVKQKVAEGNLIEAAEILKRLYSSNQQVRVWIENLENTNRVHITLKNIKAELIGENN